MSGIFRHSFEPSTRDLGVRSSGSHEAELFTGGGNDTVVPMPGRQFPGILVQGGSLYILRSDVAEVVDA